MEPDFKEMAERIWQHTRFADSLEDIEEELVALLREAYEAGQRQGKARDE